MDSSIPKKPKKVGWMEKQCILCNKHGGLHKSHNTCDCSHFNKGGTSIKKNGGASNPNLKEKGCEGANFVQIFRAESQKGFHEH